MCGLCTEVREGFKAYICQMCLRVFERCIVSSWVMRGPNEVA